MNETVIDNLLNLGWKWSNTNILKMKNGTITNIKEGIYMLLLDGSNWPLSNHPDLQPWTIMFNKDTPTFSVFCSDWYDRIFPITVYSEVLSFISVFQIKFTYEGVDMQKFAQELSGEIIRLKVMLDNVRAKHDMQLWLAAELNSRREQPPK